MTNQFVSGLLTKESTRVPELRRNLDGAGCVPTFPPAHVTYMIDHLYDLEGGGEQALLRILRHLPRDRFRPSVVTFNVKPRSVEILHELQCPLHLFPIQRTYDWPGLKAASRIRALLRTNRSDIVHTFFETSNTWGGLITKLSFGPLLVSSRRDMGILRLRKHDIMYKMVNLLSDGVQAVSKEVARMCIEREGINPSKVFTVYNGIDMVEVDRPARMPFLKARLGFEAASHIVTTVANVRRVKGLDTFLQAAAIVRSKFKSALFVIAGRPNEQQYLRELQLLVESLNLSNNVRFLSELDEVFSLLKLSNVFCLLSHSEGFSNALLEAMACHLPCVVTRVGGNPEAINDGENGYLVPNDDPMAAAARIAMLLETPERAREIGRQARKTVETRFTVERMVHQLTQSYDRLLQPRRSSNVRRLIPAG